jgi:SAM-dependent methyltransferase
MNECERDEFKYQGEELDLFSRAANWKDYWGRILSPVVQGRVLDVGAGQGNNISVLLNGRCISWTALEPDSSLLARIPRLGVVAQDPRLRTVVGDIHTLSSAQTLPEYDTIIYIDVMEHIEDDLSEFQRASTLLAPGGHLVVLSPAFQFLYSPFDKAIGHFRRYTRRSLKRLQAESMVPVRMFFLDSVGLLLSAANCMLLKQSMPTAKQIHWWDRRVIPISRLTDVLLGHFFGRSIVGVWRKSL